LKRRVVVTGVGAVTALGLTARETFRRLLEGESGVGRITHFDASPLPCRIAAEVKDFDPKTVVEEHEIRKYDPFTLFGMAAGQEAFLDAGLEQGKFDPDRVGCVYGVGIGGLTDIEQTKEMILARGVRRVSPFFIPKIMMNAVAGQMSIKWGFRGPNFVTASACASSNHALGLAFRSIKYGEADVMIGGGCEATITPLGVAGFCALRALSTQNDEPTKASRPFDRKRDGFVMGEGAGALVLEEYERARRRGARIYAEVKGFGMTADAHHVTSPAPEGAGAARAMQHALNEGGVSPQDVQYVNAHGTSTEINDPLETQAIKSVFGDQARRMAISGTKSMTGHLLGGAGALAGVVTALSIHGSRVHPTINQEEADPDCDLDYVPNVAREMPIRNAISNSLGFGGHNAVLLFGGV
jgi:3-oxoacyl-[acyl-carrier-protein] synthase II